MVRVPCCEKMEGMRKGAWSREEDQILINYINKHDHENWRALPKKAGLLRCGKSCRLRWMNYLRPGIKLGNFTYEEENTIIWLHQSLGNRWAAIASELPGRTDNEVKNVWHTRLKHRAWHLNHLPNVRANLGILENATFTFAAPPQQYIQFPTANFPAYPSLMPPPTPTVPMFGDVTASSSTAAGTAAFATNVAADRLAGLGTLVKNEFPALNDGFWNRVPPAGTHGGNQAGFQVNRAPYNPMENHVHGFSSGRVRFRHELLTRADELPAEGFRRN